MTINDVNNGIMPKWEYRMKWYGETEEEAKAVIDGINRETSELSDNALMFGDDA